MTQFYRFQNTSQLFTACTGHASKPDLSQYPTQPASEGDVIVKVVAKVVKKPKIEKKQKPLELGRKYQRVNEAYQNVTIIAKDIDGNFIGRNEHGGIDFFSAAGRLLHRRSSTNVLQDRGVDTKFDLKVEFDEVEVGSELVIEPV